MFDNKEAPKRHRYNFTSSLKEDRKIVLKKAFTADFP